eukprot:351199-Chlamydomonas_euryale.AAC.2
MSAQVPAAFDPWSHFWPVVRVGLVGSYLLRCVSLDNTGARSNMLGHFCPWTNAGLNHDNGSRQALKIAAAFARRCAEKRQSASRCTYDRDPIAFYAWSRPDCVPPLCRHPWACPLQGPILSFPGPA